APKPEMNFVWVSSIATIDIYKLVKIDYSHSTALKSVFYLSIFPTSYFLIAGYTESLFLFLTIGCFYYVRKGNWLPAGVMGMLASATRITGLVDQQTSYIFHLSPPIVSLYFK
ncbi:MAG: hypothetical protein QMD80_05165, partial [archaeon]|nr:hypothetical protein [archaeon]